MVYRVIGLMSGSSLDGLDIVFAQLAEEAGKWSYDIREADCVPYPEDWIQRLQKAVDLSAVDYQLLHTDLGHYIGKEVNRFIERHQLNYQVQLVVSHGHTSFHIPGRKTTAQLGDGAAIAALTGIHTVSDLRAVDIALGGQGAPIVPIGEKYFWPEYDFFLNLGGIANISCRTFFGERGRTDQFLAFDVCPANRVLNLLAQQLGRSYDEDGKLAKSGRIDQAVLDQLNAFAYYGQSYPKSLSNDFGVNELYPLLKKWEMPLENALCTYSEHIACQIEKAIQELIAGKKTGNETGKASYRLLVTGGGAHNLFLLEILKRKLTALNVSAEVPEKKLVDYKEALVMCLIGVLRWRGECNVLSTVTGAIRDSVGGAVWEGTGN